MALTGSHVYFCTTYSDSDWPRLDHMPLPGARGRAWSASPKPLGLRVGVGWVPKEKSRQYFENNGLDARQTKTTNMYYKSQI